MYATTPVPIGWVIFFWLMMLPLIFAAVCVVVVIFVAKAVMVSLSWAIRKLSRVS